jgi:hypothetical protein
MELVPLSRAFNLGAPMTLMDLIRSAGLDTRDWKRSASSPDRASSNPKYCYEWVFKEDYKLVVLNLWRTNIEKSSQREFVKTNMRANARNSSKEGIKPIWRIRALRVDEALAHAYDQRLPIRVILLEGRQRRWGVDERASRVSRRELDPVPWAVESYDHATGLAVLVRGLSPKAFVPPQTKPRRQWGRPDPRSEGAAIRHVTKYLRRKGYSVFSRERENCGYDLHASRGKDEVHVEVKGCRGVIPVFFLSQNEYTKGKNDGAWRLAVVTEACAKPGPPRFLTFKEMDATFRLIPTQWAARGVD